MNGRASKPMAKLSDLGKIMGMSSPHEQPRECKGLNIKRIDAYAFAQMGKEAQGAIPLVRLTRVVDGLPEQPQGDAGLVTWSVRGEMGRTGLLMGRPLLHIHVQANPVLVCQRCNEPFVYPIDSEVLLQLVKSEADLDDDASYGDPSGEDDEDEEGNGFVSNLPEKVVGSHHFDLLAQIEDELILSVPYVPKHDVCPGALAKVSEASPEEPAVKRPSPFAVLEQLKHKD